MKTFRILRIRNEKELAVLGVLMFFILTAWISCGAIAYHMAIKKLTLGQVGYDKVIFLGLSIVAIIGLLVKFPFLRLRLRKGQGKAVLFRIVSLLGFGIAIAAFCPMALQIILFQVEFPLFYFLSGAFCLGVLTVVLSEKLLTSLALSRS